MKMCTIARAQSATVLQVNFHKVWRATLQIMRTVNSFFVCQINLLLHFAPSGENSSSFTLKFRLFVVIVIVCRLSFSLKIQLLIPAKTPASNMAQASTQRQRNKLSIAIFSAARARRKWKFAVEFIICIIKMMTNGVERESRARSLAVNCECCEKIHASIFLYYMTRTRPSLPLSECYSDFNSNKNAFFELNLIMSLSNTSCGGVNRQFA